MHVCTLLADALDLVLTVTIFTAGQTGLAPEAASRDLGAADARWQDQSGSIIWCAPYEEVQQKYPSLPQARGEGIGTEYECVDLTVAITRGNITDVDFEGLSLAETFTALGRYQEAEAADRLLGTPVQPARGPLAELLAALLSSPVH